MVTDAEAAEWRKWVDGVMPNTTPSCKGMVGPLLADRERVVPWLPVIAQVENQDERWKMPMPDISDPNAAMIWALKASEEMGELSAALLGRAIGKDGRGDPLEECYQLMAVLLRVAGALLKEVGRDA